MRRQPYLLAGLAVLGLAATFFQQWYPLSVLGPAKETDALFVGLAIPQMIILVVTGTLSAALTPLLSAVSGNRLADEAWSLATAAGAALTVVALLIGLTAEFWLPYLTPGFSVVTRGLATRLTLIQSPGLIFAGMAAVQTSAFHARGQFLRAESLNVLAQGVGIVVMMLAIPHLGVAGAAWGITLRYVAVVFLQAGYFGVPNKICWRTGSVSIAWLRIKPLLFGTAFARMDQLADIFLASLAGAGWVSLFTLAQQLHGAGNLVLNRAVCRPMIPGFARAAVKSDRMLIESGYDHTLRITGGVSLSVLLVVFLLGEQAAGIVFPNFGATSLDDLWRLMMGLAGVLVAGSMAQVPVAGFYALGDTATPTRVAVYGMFIGIALKATGFFLAGMMGLAIATSLYYTVNLAVLHFVFRHRLAELDTDS